jgi:hypothetical protein
MNVAFKFSGFALLMAQLTFSGSVAFFFGQQAALASSPTVTPHPSALLSNQGDDPDMGGREGVPPNSVGSGTR